ncbi:MAG: 3TM-type holin [Pseudomonadota bacterium]
MTPLAGLLIDVAGRALDKVLPDTKAKTKAQAELANIIASKEAAELETRLKVILAEATSEDKWISRARPTFLYVIYAVIGLCVLAGIASIWWPSHVAIATAGFGGALMAVPDSLWALFGAGYLGYSAVRSYDKRRPR